MAIPMCMSWKVNVMIMFGWLCAVNPTVDIINIYGANLDWGVKETNVYNAHIGWGMETTDIYDTHLSWGVRTIDVFGAYIGWGMRTSDIYGKSIHTSSNADYFILKTRSRSKKNSE